MVAEKIKTRIKELVEFGEKVLATKRKQHYEMMGTVTEIDSHLFHQWHAESLSFLKMTFGEESTHYKLFSDKCRNSESWDAEKGTATLRAAQTDIENGYLKSLETLVSADIFTDFLEMSEHLLQEGYKDPAASLIGAVLEDGLRKISANHSVKVKTKEDISSLNQKLAQANVYNRLTQKRIQVWNDIRNNADHGHFNEYDSDLVDEMLKGVQSFLEQYL